MTDDGFTHHIPPWDVAKQSWDDYIKARRLAVERALDLAYAHANTARKATRVADQILRSCRVSLRSTKATSPFVTPCRGNISQPRSIQAQADSGPR